MEQHLVVLDRFLTNLGIEPNVSTLRDRKRVQKAVYLGQAAGADLGYRFSWYLLGPYSPSLTRDYFDLADSQYEGESVPENLQLHPSLAQHLDRTRPIISLPQGVEGLELEDWLELCASVHYQMTVLRKGVESTRAYLSDHSHKSRLVPYFDQAVEALEQVGLLESQDTV